MKTGPCLCLKSKQNGGLSSKMRHGKVQECVKRRTAHKNLQESNWMGCRMAGLKPCWQLFLFSSNNFGEIQ